MWRDVPIGEAFQPAHVDAHLLRLTLLLRPPPLSVEGGLEAGDVDDIPALSRHELRQINRKTEGVIQTKGVFTADRAANLGTAIGGLHRRQLIEARETAFDRGQE